MRAAAAVVFVALTIVALVPPAQAANFGVHAGLANGIWRDPYFRAGALLADVDHWLPPTEPQTDSTAFALGVAQRAWTGSRNAWRFADGWYEHLDQDTRFSESYGRIVAAFPTYTVVDVRLAFDDWTIRKHPFPTDFDWLLGDSEVLTLIAGGLTATDEAGVRAAVDGLLHSTDVNTPGLALQLAAAQAWGILNPDKVANMEAEYDRFYAATTAGFTEVLARLDVRLNGMAALVWRYAANPMAVVPSLHAAQALEAVRPSGWMAQEVAALAAFVDALPRAGLPLRILLELADRASWIMDYVS